MKSQDILLLLKLVALDHAERAARPTEGRIQIPNDWQGWSDDGWESDVGSGTEITLQAVEPYSVRALQSATGISKSEVSGALRRLVAVGLIKDDRFTGRPKVNTKGLYEFIAHGLKYVFPAPLGAISRGIPTAGFAPVLAGKLMSGGDRILVWADPMGKSIGQLVPPLYKSVPEAIRRDPELYALLALVDSIRVGNEREASVARQLLQKYLDRADENV